MAHTSRPLPRCVCAKGGGERARGRACEVRHGRAGRHRTARAARHVGVSGRQDHVQERPRSRDAGGSRRLQGDAAALARAPKRKLTTTDEAMPERSVPPQFLSNHRRSIAPARQRALLYSIAPTRRPGGSSPCTVLQKLPGGGGKGRMGSQGAAGQRGLAGRQTASTTTAAGLAPARLQLQLQSSVLLQFGDLPPCYLALAKPLQPARAAACPCSNTLHLQ